MELRKLPRTELTVSRAVLGTMTFGGQADEAESRRILDCALDAGVNFVDTANAYGKGASEEILGRLLDGRRAQVVLASKVFNRMGDGADDQGLSPAAIRKAIEASLRRLRTDYLDVYYLHQPDAKVPIEESLGAMDELVRAGKVRYVASSNYAAWQVARMQSIPPAATITQPMYNLLARGIEQEYLPMIRALGLSTVVYNPLAGGLLTGKQNREQPLAGTRFDANKMYLDRYWHQQMFDAVESLRKAAVNESRTLIEMSLAWLLHHTMADCIILGASRAAQLQENLKAFDAGPLTSETLSECDAVWRSLRGPTPNYNR